MLDNGKHDTPKHASDGADTRFCLLFAKFCEKIRRNCGWALLSMAVDRLKPKLLTASLASIRSAIVMKTRTVGRVSAGGAEKISNLQQVSLSQLPDE